MDEIKIELDTEIHGILQKNYGFKCDKSEFKLSLSSSVLI